MPGKAEHPHAGEVGPGAADTGPRPDVTSALATWRGLATALAPIVGAGGFAALYRRSVQRVVPRFPWLGALADGEAARFDPDELQTALAQQSAAQGGAATAALLVEFDALLHQLIGPALAQELMKRHAPPPAASSESAD
jgi:hypothetical protein